MSALEEYRELLGELATAEDSMNEEAVDRVLEKMDDVWFRMTKEEILVIERENDGDPPVTPKVYVASSYTHRKEARVVMMRIELAGYEITLDWTPLVSDDELSMFSKEWLAVIELDGVKRADLIVWLRKGESVGKHVELGAGIIMNKPVLVMDDGSFPRDKPFYYHPHVTWTNHDEHTIGEAIGVLWQQTENIRSLYGIV